MKASKLQPALIGGVFIGVLSALPLISAGNLCCCLWVISGGVIAAYLLQQNQATPIEVADGALVGLLAGVVGAFVDVLVSIPLRMITGPVSRRVLERVMEGARDVPPEIRDAIQSVGGGAVGLVIAFIFMMCAGLIFATLGGVLGAVIFKKSAPPATAPPEVLPPM